MLKKLFKPACVGIFILVQLLPVAATAQTDSVQPQLRVPPAEDIQRYATDERFIYGGEQAGETLWTRMQRWFWDKVFDIIKTPWVRSMLEIAFYLTFIAVLLALLNQLLKGNIKTAFSGKSPNQRITFGEEKGPLPQQDLDRLLREAVNKKDFDRAVKILYQKSLLKLEETGLIAWQPDKTNHEYLAELASHPVYTSFHELTQYYEYVEYGDFHVQATRFESIKRCYNDFEGDLPNE